MMRISRSHRRFIGRASVALTLIALVALLAQWLGRGSAIPYQTPPQTVQMRLVEMPPPPSPPPPPPPQQKLMEVEKQPEFTEAPPAEEAPVEQSNEAPPTGPLALDAPGQGPADGFALAGRPGGTGSLGGSGGGGNRFAWYSALVQGRISQALQQQRRLYEAKYEVPALIWIGEDGSVEKVELVESSGTAEIDRLLVRAIESMPRLPQPPPQDMPQPIATRIRAS